MKSFYDFLGTFENVGPEVYRRLKLENTANLLCRDSTALMQQRQTDVFPERLRDTATDGVTARSKNSAAGSNWPAWCGRCRHGDVDCQRWAVFWESRRCSRDVLAGTRAHAECPHPRSLKPDSYHKTTSNSLLKSVQHQLGPVVPRAG